MNGLNKENKDLVHPIVIGDLVISNNIFLAPMAGGSEMAFRTICRKKGAGFTFTELSTVKGMRYQKSVERNFKYLEISQEELPVAIQLFGSDPEDFEYAIDLIFEHELLSKCSMIDINMGCPVPKVTKNGSGSALMKNPEVAGKIIKASKKKSPVPVSCKIRMGWNESSVNAVEFAKMCEASGVDMLTIHGRTTNQMYSGKANWEIIKQVKNELSIPVVGNGDITNGMDAERMLLETNVDAIMIGRAALGNPFIFEEIKYYLTHNSLEGYVRPDLGEKIAVIREQMDRSIIQFGEQTALKEMRKHFAWYLKGVPYSNKMKNELMTCKTKKEANIIFDTLLEIFI